MAEWTLNIPDSTDRCVKTYLEKVESKDAGDLSKFVDRVVRQAIFWDTFAAVQERNKDLTPEEAEKLANELVAESRANRP